jgi:hypothetical protein
MLLPKRSVLNDRLSGFRNRMCTSQGPACQFSGRMIECEATDKPGSPGFFFRRGAENALCFRLKDDHAEKTFK